MTEARRFWIGDAQIAGDPTAKMPGVGRDHAILGQDIVQRLAQRPRVNVLSTRLIGIRAVMVVSRPNALTRAIVAATRLSGTLLFKFGQEDFGRRLRIPEHGKLYRHLVTQLWRFDIDLRDSCSARN